MGPVRAGGHRCLMTTKRKTLCIKTPFQIFLVLHKPGVSLRIPGECAGAPKGSCPPELGPQRSPPSPGRHRWYYCLFALGVSSAFFLLRWVDAEEAVTLLEITERAGTGSGRERKCQRALTRGWGAAHTPGGLLLLQGSLLGTGGGTGTPCRDSAMS